MINIFRISHILLTYFMSFDATEISKIWEKEENSSHIVQVKRLITNLLLTYKISTVC